MKRNSLTTVIVAGIAGGVRMRHGVDHFLIRHDGLDPSPFFSCPDWNYSTKKAAPTAKCNAARLKRSAKKRRKAKARRSK